MLIIGPGILHLQLTEVNTCSNRKPIQTIPFATNIQFSAAQKIIPGIKLNPVAKIYRCAQRQVINQFSKAEFSGAGIAKSDIIDKCGVIKPEIEHVKPMTCE